MSLSWNQVLNADENPLTTIEGLRSDSLKYFSANGSQLASLAGLDGISSSLQRLEVHGCQLASLEGISAVPDLIELTASSNQLTKVEELDALSNLEVLNLAENQLAELDGIDWSQLESLRALKLSGNPLESAASLAPLKRLPKLEDLVLEEAPVTEEEEFVTEVLILLPHLVALNGAKLTHDQRKAAKAEKKRRDDEAAEAEAAAAAEDEEEEED